MFRGNSKARIGGQVPRPRNGADESRRSLQGIELSGWPRGRRNCESCHIESWAGRPHGIIETTTRLPIEVALIATAYLPARNLPDAKRLV